MKHEGSTSLFQYWNRLRGERPVPRRTDIEPADIKHLLADTFILEQDVRGEPVFRLAGTRLCATYGRELKGFAFTSLWSPKDRAEIADLTRGALANKIVGTVCFDGVSREGRLNPFELLMLPLDGGRDHPRALGSLISLEKPFWLGADPIEENRVTSTSVVDPASEPASPTERLRVAVPSLETPIAPGYPVRRGLGGGGRRIRHLVVFEGGRDEEE